MAMPSLRGIRFAGAVTSYTIRNLPANKRGQGHWHDPGASPSSEDTMVKAQNALNLK